MNSLNPCNIRGCLRTQVHLAKLTSWRVGGPAEWLYEPVDAADLAVFLAQVPTTMPIFWLGLGSNVLIRDGGIPGVVILTAGLLNDLTVLDNATMRVEAGVSCAKVAKTAARQNWGEAEFLAGIPGTMGGALAMNAGAWGGETWKLVKHVETLSRQGVIQQRPVTDYQVSYRHVEGPVDEWFIAATLTLTPDAGTDGQERIKALLRQRNASQPLGLPSCGSVFRNPPGNYAARLIEQNGWKGKRIGGAYVSEKHSNFIINDGSATAADIETLIHYIQADIAHTYQIQLQPEVRIVGHSA